MSKSTETRFETSFNLRDALYAGKDVWVDEIDDLLRGLQPDILDDDWVVNDGLYKNGSAYAPTSDEYYRDETTGSKTVQFSYRPSYYGSSDWIPRIRHFWVTYDTTWDSELDVDMDRHSPRSGGPSAFVNRNTKKEPKYTVGGLLADPIVTSSVERVINHVTEQFERVKDRVLFNLEIERMAADGRTSNQGEPRHSSPVRVSGVGEDTVERLASHFGAYSNILEYDEEYVCRFLSTAWGNNPDSSSLMESVENAVSQYINDYNDGEVKSSLLPEDLVDYPQKQPTRHGINITPHAVRREESEDSQNKSESQRGDVSGADTETTHIGTLRTLSIAARSDGVWVLTPTQDAHSGAFEISIPFGTEQQERSLAQRWYGHNLQDTYLHDVYIATQLLEHSWEVCVNSPSFSQVSESPFDTSKIDTADSGITERTVYSTLSNLTQYLSKYTGWTPSVWSEGLHVRGEPELEYLLDCIPADLLDEWDSRVFSSSNNPSVWFKCNPEDINQTSWVLVPGGVRIKYSDDYDPSIDADPVSNESEPKYILEGTLVDPIATQSAARFLSHIEKQVKHVEESVRFNAKVERVHFKQKSEESDMDSETVKQTDIFSELTGIGFGTENQLAEEYGTYANLIREDTVDITLSHHFDGTTDDLQDLIEPAVKQCLEDCGYESDKWSDYPKC